MPGAQGGGYTPPVPDVRDQPASIGRRTALSIGAVAWLLAATVGVFLAFVLWGRNSRPWIASAMDSETGGLTLLLAVIGGLTTATAFGLIRLFRWTTTAEAVFVPVRAGVLALKWILAILGGVVLVSWYLARMGLPSLWKD